MDDVLAKLIMKAKARYENTPEFTDKVRAAMEYHTPIKGIESLSELGHDISGDHHSPIYRQHAERLVIEAKLSDRFKPPTSLVVKPTQRDVQRELVLKVIGRIMSPKQIEDAKRPYVPKHRATKLVKGRKPKP
jgi:hypothetical protein